MHKTKPESVSPLLPPTGLWHRAEELASVCITIAHTGTAGKHSLGSPGENHNPSAHSHSHTGRDSQDNNRTSVMHVVTSSHITSSHKQKCLHPFRCTIWKLSLWTNTSMLCPLLVASLSFCSWGQKNQSAVIQARSPTPIGLLNMAIFQQRF